MATERPFRIVIAEPFDSEAISRLEAIGRVDLLQDSSPASILQAVSEADALLVRTKAHVTARIIGAATHLKVIGRAGPNVDHIDMRAAKRHNVQVVYTPNVAVDSIAEFTLGLILALSRRILYYNRHIRQGEFEGLRIPWGREMRRQTLGFLGLDEISDRLAEICTTAFGMRLIYHDPMRSVPPAFQAESLDFAEFLKQVDILSIHLPLTPETRGLLGPEAIASLKPSTLIVNTSRGAVVDTVALAEALKTKRLAGAGLDVYEIEPLPADHALRTAPNCILTPHVAAATIDVNQGRFQVVDDVLRVLRGEQPVYPADGGEP